MLVQMGSRSNACRLAPYLLLWDIQLCVYRILSPRSKRRKEAVWYEPTDSFYSRGLCEKNKTSTSELCRKLPHRLSRIWQRTGDDDDGDGVACLHSPGGDIIDAD